MGSDTALAGVRFCRWCFTKLQRNNRRSTCAVHRYWTGEAAPKVVLCHECPTQLPKNNESGFCRAHKSLGPAEQQRNRESSRLRGIARRAENQAFLDSVKLTAGCMDCGYNTYAIALDFDHLPELGVKKFNVSHRTGVVNIAHLLAEIAKCEVVCANCHRVRTQKRGQYRVRLRLVAASTVSG